MDSIKSKNSASSNNLPKRDNSAKSENLVKSDVGKSTEKVEQRSRNLLLREMFLRVNGARELKWVEKISKQIRRSWLI